MTNVMMDFIEEVASDQPTPAGGSASAMSGALGCALMLKASKLLLKQRKHTNDKQLQAMQKQLEVAKANYIAFSALDSETFNEFLKATKIKHMDIKQKQDTIENALIKATELPLEVMKQTLDLAVTLDKLLVYGPYSFISDVHTATLLLNVAFTGSMKNVLHNIKSIKTDQEVNAIRVKVDEMSNQWNYFLHVFDQYEQKLD